MGNTPTCVGKTNLGLLAATYAQKHPHVRGEDAAIAAIVNAILETPPRAWGRRIVITKQSNRTRNTPTCVGKTNYRAYYNSLTQKHPHVRGEDLRSLAISDM